VDDVLKFVKRERNRGKKYDAIILDPPAFGRGTQGQVWKIEKDLTELLSICKDVLSDNPLFIFLTTYSIESSSLAIGNLLQDLMVNFKGRIETGEMTLQHQSSEKLLPMSIFANWRRD
jgi:23S rRNA (cytosine1962-C5)-methyltransferase